MTASDRDAAKPPWIRIVVGEAGWDQEAFAKLVHEGRPGNVVVRVLRGTRMRNFGGLFDEFATQLAFPAYFGRNYNALKDCLTDLAWLPGGGYVLVIRDAAMALTQETEDDFSALLDLLHRASDEWAPPIAESQAWDREAVPFHIVLQVEARDLPQLRSRLERAGVASI